MKILHLITSLKVGGAESALVNYLSKVVGFDGNTHSVAYFHFGPNAKKIEDLGIDVYKISGALSIYDPIFFFRLVKLVKLVNPDIIHSSLWSANIISRLISKFYKIPVVCDLHGNSFDEGKLRNWFDRKTVHLCGKVVAVSDSVKDAYLKNITDKADKIIVIKNGIDVEALRSKALQKHLSRSEFKIPDSAFVVGAVGRLEPIKSYDVLVRAFDLFMKLKSKPNAKLIIVGDGSQRRVLQDLIRSLGIENHVVFTGVRSDAYKFYPLFNCFALSSQSEGLSIALLEAMSFGLPIITTHCDLERHDVIKPGINGFLISPGDIDGYADAINNLYENPGRASRIGEINLASVRSEFSIEGVVSRYQNVFSDVLS